MCSEVLDQTHKAVERLPAEIAERDHVGVVLRGPIGRHRSTEVSHRPGEAPQLRLDAHCPVVLGFEYLVRIAHQVVVVVHRDPFRLSGLVTAVMIERTQGARV